MPPVSCPDRSIGRNRCPAPAAGFNGRAVPFAIMGKRTSRRPPACAIHNRCPPSRSTAQRSAPPWPLRGLRSRCIRLCSMAIATPQVLAPAAARTFGLQPSRVGLLIAFYFACLMPAGLMAGPLLARFGMRRVCQLTAALVASGLLLGAANGLFAAARPPGETPGLLAALFVLLLFGATGILGLGYGLMNPIGSQIVFRATPAAYRSMMFSVKQSAVPIGGALAGVFFPAALALMDWYWSVALVGALIAASVFAMRAGWFRERLDDARQDGAAHTRLPFRVRAEDFTAPLRPILSRPRLRELAFAGICYNANQIALVTFTIAYLNLEIGLSLIASGAVFSAGQSAGMIGRILWGVVADRWVAPRKLLGALGVAAALSGMSFAAMSPGWPLAALFALS